MNTRLIPNFLKAAAAGMATIGMAATLSMPAMAQDMSNGADNFYTSDKVTVQKVTFKNQYQMNVAGNLFIPRDARPECEESRHHRRPSDGCGEGAKRQSVCHEDGRAGLRHLVPGLVVLGRERRPAAQRSFRRTSMPRTSARRWISWARSPLSTGNGSAPSAFAAAAASSSAPPRSTRA